MNKNIIVLALAALALFSCKTQEQAVKEVTHEKDSVNISRVEKYRDTTVIAPIKQEQQKNAIVIRDVGLVNSDTSTVATEFARSLAWVKNGLLFHTIETTKAHIPIYLSKAVKEVKTEIYKGKSKSFVKTITIHTTTNILTKWQRFFMSLGYVFVGVIAACFLYCICRFGAKIKGAIL